MESPLLTIYIATYKGAQYLKISLQALLPQVAQAGGAVEVLIVDDASPDDTAHVVREAQKFGPIRYVRNQINRGSPKNLVYAPIEHATGEFIWGLSQHCLIYPGAMARLLVVLKEKKQLDAFYVNFRCATYPRDWPAEALGGYAGPFDYLSGAGLKNRDIPHWEELLDANTAVCTQSYAHIIKRQVWIQYWSTRTMGADFSDHLTTYPHACAVAESMFGRPSYYIGEPMLTIYNGAQWWGSLKSRAKAYFVGHPELLGLYRLLGWKGDKLRAAEEWGAGQAQKVMVEVFREAGGAVEERKLLKGYFWRYWPRPGVFRAFWKAFLDSESFWLGRCITHGQKTSGRIYQYWFYNCRPARWFRNRPRIVK